MLTRVAISSVAVLLALQTDLGYAAVTPHTAVAPHMAAVTPDSRPGCGTEWAFDAPYPGIERGYTFYPGGDFVDGGDVDEDFRPRMDHTYQVSVPPYSNTASPVQPLADGFVSPGTTDTSTGGYDPYFRFVMPSVMNMSRTYQLVPGGQNGQVVSTDHYGMFWQTRLYLVDSVGDIGSWNWDSFVFGNAGDIPVYGDWDGNGTITIGIFRPSNATWYLTNNVNFRGGAPDVVFQYGNPGDVPVVGDWNCDGVDTPGMFRNGYWFLKNTNSGGGADGVFLYGNPADTPIVGDWNGDGTATLGVYRGNRWYLTNNFTSGIADTTFLFGQSGDRPILRLPY